MNKYIYGHTSEDTAYVVNDYPYGFRLRTQIRYWMETTSRGDRFCSQTLNPKTGKWNKAKKSTYCEAGVMFLDENNYVKWAGLHAGSYQDFILAWCSEVGAENFSDQQYKKVKIQLAFARAMENVTFTCENVTFQTDEEAKERAEEQARVNQNINKLINYEYSKI